jgi:hypothetical protein
VRLQVVGVLAATELGATWKVACVSVSVSDHKETMKPAVPPAVSYLAGGIGNVAV